MDKKRFLKDFFRYFFKSPVLPSLTVIAAVVGVFFTINKRPDPVSASRISAMQYARSAETAAPPAPEETTVQEAVVTGAVNEVSTEAADTQPADSAETTTAAVTTEPAVTTTAAPEDFEPPYYDYAALVSKFSENYDYYKDNLVIVGDSVASGFNVFGYIPDHHNIARESMALWNMQDYYFDIGGGGMSVQDAAAYANSSLYYLSIGMNDIYGMDTDTYAQSICALAEELLGRVPTATIVVGAITPVTYGCYYTSNDILMQYNAALEYAVGELKNSRIIYFNTNDVLCDHSSMTLNYSYASDDGLHLQNSAYSQILSCLFNYLDLTPAKKQMEAHDKQFGVSYTPPAAANTDTGTDTGENYYYDDYYYDDNNYYDDYYYGDYYEW